jgi:hypothetical protein
MIGFDIFNNDAFSSVSLMGAVDKLGYVPSFLRTLPGLVVPVPVRTEMVFIESRANAPAMIQTDDRGEAPKEIAGDRRNVYGFKSLRLAQKSRLSAASLQNIRAFGSETDLQAMQTEVARRMVVIGRNVDLTEENLFLGMVQGLVIDADGETTLFDWAEEFDQTIPAELNFDLENVAPASGAVRKACAQVKRSVLKGLQGLGGNAVNVVGLCGDDFWDDLTAHPEVRQTYLNTMEAASLRLGSAWESFSYGGITFTNYRGSDDSEVAIVSTKCRFFPTNAGIFQMAYSPGESFDFVGTLGRPRYSGIVMDKDRNAWADIEVYSYPLPVCVQPQALYRGKNTAAG